MGDLLRRVLYPLLLPAIVFCVWANAWAVKQESSIPTRALSPTVTTVPPYASAPRQKAPATGYGLARDDGFASTDESSDGH